LGHFSVVIFKHGFVLHESNREEMWSEGVGVFGKQYSIHLLPVPLVFGALCLVSGVRVPRVVFMLSLPTLALFGKTFPPSTR
jgi:hypothetical protein